MKTPLDGVALNGMDLFLTNLLEADQLIGFFGCSDRLFFRFLQVNEARLQKWFEA